MTEREKYLQRKSDKIKSDVNNLIPLAIAIIVFILCVIWMLTTDKTTEGWFGGERISFTYIFTWICVIGSGGVAFLIFSDEESSISSLIELLSQSDDDYIKEQKEADKRYALQQQAEEDEERQRIAQRQEFERQKSVALSTPEVYLQSPNMSSFRCAFMEKDKSIETFIYGNGFLEITMRDGSYLDGRLDNISVKFDKLMNMPIEAYVSNGYTRIHFYKYDEQFNSSQWKQIIGVLCSAGNTSGTFIFGDAYKGIKYFSTAAKIISKLN